LSKRGYEREAMNMIMAYIEKELNSN
jgi:hypothetical protein